MRTELDTSKSNQGSQYDSIEEKDFITIEPDFKPYDGEFEKVLYTGIKTFMYFSLQNYNENLEDVVIEVLSKTQDGKFSSAFCITTTGGADLVASILDLVYNFYCRDNTYIFDEYLYIRFNKKLGYCFKIHYRGYRWNCENKGISDNQYRPLIPTQSESDLNNIDKLWSDIIPKAGNLYANRDFLYDLERCVIELNAITESVLSDIYRNKDGVDGDESIIFQMYRFPRLKSIQYYVEAYYNLAKFCIKNNEVFQQSPNSKDIVRRILEFGIEKDYTEEKVNPCEIWLLSPFALHALRNVYERTITMSKELTIKMDHKLSDGFLSVIISNFVSYCIEDFNRWVYIRDNSYFVTFGIKSNSLKNYGCRTLSNISSIDLNRLYGKIKLFLEKKNKIGENHIDILISGYSLDIRHPYSELEGLVSLVSTCVYAKDSEIEYKVLVNCSGDKAEQPIKSWDWSVEQHYINEDTGCKSTVKVMHVNYEKLFLKKNFTDCIKSEDLIFMLDCSSLYYNEFFQSSGDSWSSVCSRLEGTTYNLNYTQTKCGTYIDSKGIMSDVDRQLAVLTNTNTTGSGIYRPVVREYLIDFMNSAITNLSITPIGELKSIYCYLSALNAKGVSRYDIPGLTHREEYDGKSFHVIGFNNTFEDSIEEVGEQPTDSDYESICFSLWSILESIALNLKDTQFCFGKTKESTTAVLDRIGIQFSWDRGMKNFQITLYISEDIKDNLSDVGKFYIEPVGNNKDKCRLLEFLKEVFSTVLGLKKFQLADTIRAAIGNALLDRASKVEHLLLCNRIFLGNLNVSSIKCKIADAVSYTEDILRNDIICNAFDKMLYFEVMRGFESFFLDSIDRTAINHKIQAYGKSPDTVLENIIETCCRCDYKESNLYYNLCK